jgi:hypothetical protein
MFNVRFKKGGNLRIEKRIVYARVRAGIKEIGVK